MAVAMMKRLSAIQLLLSLLLTMTQCARRRPVEPPRDILGIYVGMKREDAKRRLEEIAQFERDARKRQVVWKVNDNARFSHIALGYDEQDQVRYVTAFVDKAAAKERIRFSDVGDLTKAKKEIVEPHYRYIWEVPASDGKPPYFVNIYGDDPEFVLHYSLSRVAPKEKEEEDKE
jgi:hypothetical protein